jgi:hypothetical protein
MQWAVHSLDEAGGRRQRTYTACLRVAARAFWQGIGRAVTSYRFTDVIRGG